MAEHDIPVLPDNPALSEEALANRWTRLCAMMIDGCLLLIAMIPFVVYMKSRGFINFDEPGLGDTLKIIMLSATLAGFWYITLNAYLLDKYGQTIGKRLMGICIVSADSLEPLPLWKSFLVRFFGIYAIGIIPLVGLLFYLIDALCIFREDRRCLHDLLAKSVVIKTQPTMSNPQPDQICNLQASHDRVADESILASRWTRLCGFVIDMAIVVLMIVPLDVFLFPDSGGGDDETFREVMHDLFINSVSVDGILTDLIWMALSYVILNGYLLETHGQSIGKRLMGTRIVSAHDHTLLPLWKIYLMRHVLFDAIGILPILGNLAMLADSLFIFSQEKRCLHDHVAGTKVIKANVPYQATRKNQVLQNKYAPLQG